MWLGVGIQIINDVLELLKRNETKRIRIPQAEKGNDMIPATDRALHTDGTLALSLRRWLGGYDLN